MDLKSIDLFGCSWKWKLELKSVEYIYSVHIVFSILALRPLLSCIPEDVEASAVPIYVRAMHPRNTS